MKEISLNGIWDFKFLPSLKLEEVEPLGEQPEELTCVPGCFDAMPQHYCQRGCAIYSRSFLLEKDWRDGWLRIDGMGLRGSFLLDGRHIGTCALPYSTFDLETGALAAGTHRLTAVIDNNFDSEKMKLFQPYYDFYAFGGFYHGVSLRLSDEENPLDRIFVRTIDYSKGRISLEFVFKHHSPQTFSVRLAIDDEHEREYDVKNCSLEMERPDLPPWSPDSPVLHTLRASCGEDCTIETFGIREIRTEGRRILLNGKPVFLKGFNRHESHPTCGAATSLPEMLTDLQHLKQLNANFIRGCHYSQSQEFLSLCDRMGFLVWEESLGWGNIAEQMEDSGFIAQQIEQTRLMVRNSFNHPSVVIFAFLNENASQTDAGAELCHRLAETVRSENSGRLVTFACNKLPHDKALEYMDVLSYNTYPGWIQINSECDPLDEIAPNQEVLLRHLEELHGKEMPVIVSEMGCCGLYGAHDTAAAQWTEEFQAQYFAKVIDTVASSQEIAGLALWQLNDAKSFSRKGSVIRNKPLGQNLAGVYDLYRRPKLAAAIVGEKFRLIDKQEGDK